MSAKNIALSTIAALLLAMCGMGHAQAIQIINGPNVEGTGDSWAVVAWTTNAGGSSIVHYGINPNNLTQTAEAPYSGAKVHQGKVTHRVRIQNLQPNTTYYFRVDSGQGSGTGTQAQSSVQSFHTNGQGYASNAGYENGSQANPVQIIDGPRIEGAGNDWAQVAWTTNAGGSSVVHYGTDPNNLTQVAESPYAGAKVHQGQVMHRVRINNLQPNTTYYFSVESNQGSGTGTQAQSNIMTFQTGGSTATGAYSGPYNQQYPAAPGSYGANQPYGGAGPYGHHRYPTGANQPYPNSGYAAVRIIDGPRLENVTNNSATISWTTVGGGSSVIHYGNSPSALTQTAQGAYTGGAGQQGESTHTVTLNNLQSHTTYYFVADSGENGAMGPQSHSSVIPFTTR